MKTEWIRVKDVLPKVPQTVLVWHKARRVWLIATLYNEWYRSKKYHWIYYDVDGKNRIEIHETTHWQPLPTPPQE